MNVEQESGENSPDETSMPSSSSFLTNFGSNRKRQSSLSFSPTKNNNNNQLAARNGLKSCSNSHFQQSSLTSPQNNNNSTNQTAQFKSQQLFNKNFSTPKSNQQLLSNSSSTSNEQDSVIQTNSPLMKTFVKKFNYKRRLKHLPSQIQNNNNNLKKSPSSISLKNTGNKLHLADALTIFEEMLSEREEKLKEEFHMELQNKLAEQYEQFVRYNEDAVRAKFDNSCSYLS